MGKILLFGGTKEGRSLAEYLSRHKISTLVCVATSYGEQLLPGGDYIKILPGRLAKEDIEKLMEENTFDLLVDATHPYAVMISDNLQKACEKQKLPYIRVLRKTEDAEKKGIWVESVKEAVSFLQGTKGNVFITTGSKELSAFLNLTDYQQRCYVRVLANADVMEECANMGFKGKHLIGMQGPFQKDLNLAMLKQTQSSYLVTKESGSAGGFREKIEAAIEADVVSVVIGRPRKEEGFSYEETIAFLQEKYHLEREKKQISLIGAGMGNQQQLTKEAIGAIENCQVIIGASRVLEGFQSFHKSMFAACLKEEIVDFITKHSEFTRIAVVYSGDVGFYSGAKGLLPYLQEYSVQMIAGISSPVYFLNKLQIPWEDVVLLSLHGRKCNWLSKVKTNKRVFLLLGGEVGIREICQILCENHLKKVRLTVGENLSYEYERIISGTPEELKNQNFSKLAVLVIENEKAGGIRVTYGLPDSCFCRDKVPMTKSEVRSISLSKLGLYEDSILADIGAGTGSVSIEAAERMKNGMVYAIEQKAEAVNLLEENKKKFQISNMQIIKEEASKAIPRLPVITHAFIGGTAGHMQKIIEELLLNNCRMRIVINAIALESLSEITQMLHTIQMEDLEIVQVVIAKSKEAASYHMMMGQNPVYIISFTGKRKAVLKDGKEALP